MAEVGKSEAGSKSVFGGDARSGGCAYGVAMATVVVVMT